MVLIVFADVELQDGSGASVPGDPELGPGADPRATRRQGPPHQ